MKLREDKSPNSSFLSVEKDLSLITELLIKNHRLKKLLYYSTPDAESRPALNEEQTLELFKNNIKLVPKVVIDNSVLSYLIISCDNFVPNNTNPEFRDNTITFDIVCHFDQWQLQDFKMRPYRIAGEIDSMIAGKRLTGIGKVEFLGATQMILNDEFAGLTVMYQVINGDEDKEKPLNPEDERFIL